MRKRGGYFFFLDPVALFPCKLLHFEEPANELLVKRRWGGINFGEVDEHIQMLKDLNVFLLYYLFL